ncbi:FKBP-type peptidyl-prolyl cis-trans isomerase [Pedobacter sp. SD-b]|uniref:Peptidyl-prolyl cis-trans isomerase n=1 Tax=Pedobacter segetis TaxID=2793069 RepID=A0ABS1BLG2_9SPHI|nr:FKBP-type peptidyl-prolyl cis-trans isomerase [Pedobacter segetis]MBK0383734.1 FKBP-type peptidyl-prolyl cis-trans isomerase [Pedobacter segetis]
MIKKYLAILLLATVVLGSCKKETRDLRTIEDQQIQAFIKTNNLTGFTKDSSGFYYQILDEGNGAALQNSDFIYYLKDIKDLNGNDLKPNGALTQTGKTSSYLSEYLGYLSKSYRESLLNVKKGGSVRVLVPSYLAYGKDGYGSTIKGNEILDAKLQVINGLNQTEVNDSLITKYKSTLPLAFTRDSSGVYYSIISNGNGTETITTASTLKVAYTGKLFNGVVFDSATANNPLQSTLINLIPGWQETLVKIKKGGKIRILVPAYLGYGGSSYGNIPANTPLDFDIEVVDVTN